MSKRKNIFLVNQNQSNSQLLREQFHKKLTEKGLIEEIAVEYNETILIEETNKNAKLKRIIINHLNYSTEKFTVKRIWKVNLEQDIVGISSKNISKTPECALLILQEFQSDTQTKSYRLCIILLELKSTLKIKLKPNKRDAKPETTEIEEKLMGGMNRLYMLLSLNNHFNPIQGYEQASIHLEFRGVIIYNKDDINDPNNNNPLCSIVNQANQAINNLLTLGTIINDKDKILIKCFPKLPQDLEEQRIIPLQDLLN